MKRETIDLTEVSESDRVCVDKVRHRLISATDISRIRTSVLLSIFWICVYCLNAHLFDSRGFHEKKKKKIKSGYFNSIQISNVK